MPNRVQVTIGEKTYSGETSVFISGGKVTVDGVLQPEPVPPKTLFQRVLDKVFGK